MAGAETRSVHIARSEPTSAQEAGDSRLQHMQKASSSSPTRQSQRIQQATQAQQSAVPTEISKHDTGLVEAVQPAEAALKRKHTTDHVDSDSDLDSKPLKRAKTSNPVAHWAETGSWPEQDNFDYANTLSLFLAKQITMAESNRQRYGQYFEAASTPTAITPSDQKLRDEKSAPYKDEIYADELAYRGSFIREPGPGVTTRSLELCQKLLDQEQPTPENTLFRSDLFSKTCYKLQARNESKVIQDVARLIVPSAEHLSIYGNDHLSCLVESVNEGWNRAVPFYGTRPQPDYSVGFHKSAFTADQIVRLRTLVGTGSSRSHNYYMSTWRTYLPFFTAEVKSVGTLDIADRQNAHSATLAVRGMIELFRLVNREKELDREILAFSISHDNSNVRIYGHYAVIEGRKTSFYRHPIHSFDFTVQNGKEKWTSYKFTKNIYDNWMPMHLKRICSVLDALPEVNFAVPALPSTGLSQGFEDQQVSATSESHATAITNSASSSSPNTSYAETGEGAFQQPRSIGKRRRE